jgi:hypothetical protein
VRSFPRQTPTVNYSPSTTANKVGDSYFVQASPVEPHLILSGKSATLISTEKGCPLLRVIVAFFTARWIWGRAETDGVVVRGKVGRGGAEVRGR